jgi:ComF family protein
MLNPPGSNPSRNSTAADAVGMKRTVPGRAGFGKDTCFRYCYYERSAANGAVTGFTSCGRFRCPDVRHRRARIHRVTHQPMQVPMAALHSMCSAAILTSCDPGRTLSSRRVREAVFSSTGFRIRATQGQAADHGFAGHDLAKHGLAGLAERAAATLFFTFFPADCRICSSPLIRVSRLPVCQNCLLALRPLPGTYCSVCGETLHTPAYFDRGSAQRGVLDDAETRCLLCQRTDPPFERAVAYGSYDAGLRDLIHLLKFQQVRPAAALLGRMLAETIANLEPIVPSGKIAVIPVPLHKSKQAQRGFNQAEMIARTALKHLAQPKRFDLCTGALLRQRETGSQIGLTRHQRRANLRGAFAVNEPTRIANRDILLIDDVFTTGTTASECARVLRRAGAGRGGSGWRPWLAP